MIKQSENRYVEEILKVLQKIASGEFNTQISISDENDELNAIASGVNMLSEEIEAYVLERNIIEEKLKNKIDELERFKKITIDRELKMRELKKEIDKLLKKLGEKPRYIH